MYLNNYLISLIKKIGIVLSIALGGGLIAYFVATHDDITYEASVIITVGNNNPKPFSQIDQNAKKICKEYEKKISYYLVVTSVPAQKVTITIADSNQKNSKKLANAIGKRVLEQLKMLGEENNFELKEATSTKKNGLSSQKIPTALTGAIASGIIAAAILAMISLRRKMNITSLDDTMILPKFTKNGGDTYHA